MRLTLGFERGNVGLPQPKGEHHLNPSHRPTDTPVPINRRAASHCHRPAANREPVETSANDLDRYLNLELGPPMWRGLTDDLTALPETLEKIDQRMEATAANVYDVSFKISEIKSAQSRAEKVVEYLQMQNVDIPPREVWAV